MRDATLCKVVGTILLTGCSLHVSAQTSTPAADTAAIEAEIKLKELQLRLRQAEQNLRDAEIKELEQAQKAEAARRLIARQALAESQLDLVAANAVSASEMSRDLQLASKLKELLGNAPSIGKEGAITITDGATSQLLATRSGSAFAAMQVAKQICADLKTANVVGAYIAPTGFDQKVLNTRFFFSEVKSIEKLADGATAQLDSVQAQAASAGSLIGGLTVLRYLIGGAQEISKALRADYGFAVSANGTRANLVEKAIAASCPDRLANVELETSLRLDSDTSGLSQSLNALISFVDKYDGKVAAVTSQLTDAQQRLVAERAKLKEKPSEAVTKRLEINIEQLEISVKGLQLVGRQLQGVEPVAKRVKAFLESLKSRETQVLDALTWANFEAKWKDRPRLQLTVSAQDVQIIKTSAWTRQRILATSHVETLFHVTDKDGKVLVSGARMQSAAAPELDLTKPGTRPFTGCAVSQAVSTCP